jgi:hypothetical protein
MHMLYQIFGKTQYKLLTLLATISQPTALHGKGKGIGMNGKEEICCIYKYDLKL